MALSIKAEELFSVGEITVTNSLLSALIVASSLISFYIYYQNHIKLVPTKFQLAIEWIVESLFSLTKDIIGENKAKRIFPLIFALFSSIIIANWFGLLPVTGSIGIAEKSYKEADSGSSGLLIINTGIHEKEEGKTEDNEMLQENKANYVLVPFLRSPSADLNFTIALSIISFILIQHTALRDSGLSYLGKFFDYRVQIGKGWKILATPFVFLINFFWKTLELVLEFSKILSFSFRLFGNIFAGEVLLAVITSLTFGLLTLPFIGFEIFVGFIQAIIFIFLTMVFIRVSVEMH